MKTALFISLFCVLVSSLFGDGHTWYYVKVKDQIIWCHLEQDADAALKTNPTGTKYRYSVTIDTVLNPIPLMEVGEEKLIAGKFTYVFSDKDMLDKQLAEAEAKGIKIELKPERLK